MRQIKIQRNPSEDHLKELDVASWPIWEKETSNFPWTYDDTETCYFLEGDVVVIPDGGEPVERQLFCCKIVEKNTL